jgi:hypothetical protein
MESETYILKLQELKLDNNKKIKDLEEIINKCYIYEDDLEKSLKKCFMTNDKLHKVLKITEDLFFEINKNLKYINH